MASVLWWYFFSKAIELMDTVLMVARKKNNQITFLHVFHHATMLNIWWWVTTWIPGGLGMYNLSQWDAFRLSFEIYSINLKLRILNNLFGC